MPERNCGIIESESESERALSINDIHPSSTLFSHYAADQKDLFREDISNPKYKVVAGFW